MIRAKPNPISAVMKIVRERWNSGPASSVITVCSPALARSSVPKLVAVRGGEFEA